MRDFLQNDMYAEAARWLAAFECETLNHDAFCLWRDSDPRHALALIHLQQLNQALRLVGMTLGKIK